VTGDELTFHDRREPEQVYVIEQARQGTRQVEVTLWNDIFLATQIEHPLLASITAAMGVPKARLVYLAKDNYRPIDPRYAKPAEEVSLADGYPYLITNTASLKDLSDKIGEELAMSRFRPNIVVETQQAWCEDDWKQLQIGAHNFRIPKPCARCRVVTINQENGEQRIELLGKIAHHRKFGPKILFGMNAIWEGTEPASISVGDSVTSIIKLS
ncbi:MAG: MOSC domain-containing protein, partial [Bacteroidota bacterium]